MIISSPEDVRIPRPCAELFEDLAPEPKTIVHLPGEHLNTRTPETLAKLVSVARRWMLERDALNP